MGILSINLHLLANSKSKFKPLSSSNLWYLRGIFSPVPVTAFRKIQVHTPRLVSDLKHNKLMLLVQHFHKGSRNFSLLSTENLWKIDNLYYPFSGHGRYPVASCNSLLLSYINFSFQSALWNPTTNEIKTLPESSVPRPLFITHAYIVCYGFGFDPASQDYKLIRFLQFRYEDGTEPYGPDAYQVELYSLKTDSWKEIIYDFHDHFAEPVQQPSVYLNGFYYWAAVGRPDFILVFDFANEEFSSDHIPLPETNMLKEGSFNSDLVEFDGSLAALVYAYEVGSTEQPSNFEIWVWNDESWSRVSIVDVPATVVKIVGLFKNDKLFLQGLNGELLLFDCAERKLENRGIHGDRRRVRIFPYVQSSIPLNGK